jgi:hypothetical protein
MTLYMAPCMHRTNTVRDVRISHLCAALFSHRVLVRRLNSPRRLAALSLHRVWRSHSPRRSAAAFRFSLSFARKQLARYRWFCVEAAPLSLLVGVLVHSGRRFLSLSLFLSFLSLSTILIGFSFSRFFYVAGRSLSAVLGRLVAAPLSADTAMRAGLCRDARATHAGNRNPWWAAMLVESSRWAEYKRPHPQARGLGTCVSLFMLRAVFLPFLS